MQLKASKEKIRLDKYLTEETSYSRETILKMIKDGQVLVNGKIVKPSYPTKLDDVILVPDDYLKPRTLKSTKMPLDIVYEDNDLMVINKPSGLTVHPGAGNYEHTLVNGLMYYTDALSESAEGRPGIVHRLDKDTSGLMIVAKSNEAHRLLADDFKNKRIHREYVALVEGIIPTNSAFIDAPIKRDKQNFAKMTVASGGKEARTHLTVIKRYKKHTLIRLVLETGRTHQIRVHLAYIGYPIVNDPVYNKKEATEFGQFLHSEYLKFKHPITGQILEFRAKLPQEFQDFLEVLEKDNN